MSKKTRHTSEEKKNAEVRESTHHYCVDQEQALNLCLLAPAENQQVAMKNISACRLHGAREHSWGGGGEKVTSTQRATSNQPCVL
jgi:hypothetical protein